MNKKSCVLYGEGKKDKKFLDALRTLDNFIFHTKDTWHIRTDSWSGDAPKVILRQCIATKESIEYALCFIDLDKLIHDNKNGWEKDKEILDTKAKELKVIIIWQDKDLEDEMRRVLAQESENKAEKLRGKSKHAINKLAAEKATLFVNSAYLKRIYAALDELEKL